MNGLLSDKVRQLEINTDRLRSAGRKGCWDRDRKEGRLRPKHGGCSLSITRPWSTSNYHQDGCYCTPLERVWELLKTYSKTLSQPWVSPQPWRHVFASLISLSPPAPSFLVRSRWWVYCSGAAAPKFSRERISRACCLLLSVTFDVSRHDDVSCLTWAVLDLRNQSNRNWGALRQAMRSSSYTFSFSNPSLCSMQICRRENHNHNANPTNRAKTDKENDNSLRQPA